MWTHGLISNKTHLHFETWCFWRATRNTFALIRHIHLQSMGLERATTLVRWSFSWWWAGLVNQIRIRNSTMHTRGSWRFAMLMVKAPASMSSATRPSNCRKVRYYPAPRSKTRSITTGGNHLVESYIFHFKILEKSFEASWLSQRTWKGAWLCHSRVLAWPRAPANRFGLGGSLNVETTIFYFVWRYVLQTTSTNHRMQNTFKTMVGLCLALQKQGTIVSWHAGDHEMVVHGYQPFLEATLCQQNLDSPNGGCTNCCWWMGVDRILEPVWTSTPWNFVLGKCWYRFDYCNPDARTATVLWLCLRPKLAFLDSKSGQSSIWWLTSCSLDSRLYSFFFFNLLVWFR